MILKPQIRTVKGRQYNSSSIPEITAFMSGNVQVCPFFQSQYVPSEKPKTNFPLCLFFEPNLATCRYWTYPAC
jgi:hypothetical protein